MILIIILKIIITIFINNDTNFFKIRFITNIYGLYSFCFFQVYTLDPISLDNIDLALYLKYLY